MIYRHRLFIEVLVCARSGSTFVATAIGAVLRLLPTLSFLAANVSSHLGTEATEGIGRMN